MTSPACEKKRGPLKLALMIETTGVGGAENVVFQMAEELRLRGHDVHPVVPMGRDGWLLDRFRDAGFKWQVYDLRHAVDLRLPCRMARTLDGLGVDVVHSHEFTMSVYGAAASRRIGKPHIITMHGNEAMTARLRRRVALRWAIRNSQWTVAVSNDTRRHLVETLGVRDDIIRVIPNGIPVRAGDRETIRRQLGVSDSDVLLLAVGNLVPRKGHAVLLEALTRLPKNGRPAGWHLAIAGEGGEQPRLEGLARDGGFAERVHLLGRRNDIPDLQAAADIFVMPSLWEGLPLAILEAMFAGNAIVASNISGIPEAIEHNQHGLLTPSGDVAALTAALQRLMHDAKERSRLGQAALERARARFTVGVMMDHYERLYRSGKF